MDKLFDVSELNIVISGASRGIGLAVANGFLENQAKVTLLSNDANELLATYQRLNIQHAGRVHYFECDVRSSEQCQAAVADAQKKFGEVTTIVCNAGVSGYKPVSEYSEENWNSLLDVNLKGAFNLAQSGIKQSLRSQNSSIIMTSSIAGHVGIQGLVPYCASKGGVEQLVRAMAVELAPKGIRVNAIAPGYVENIMAGVTGHGREFADDRAKTFTPLGRRCKLHELVGPFLFLAAPGSSYISGAVLHVDGGYSAQ